MNFKLVIDTVRMLRIYFYVATTLILLSCDNTVETNEEAAERITYFQDPRTGLCFAQITSRTSKVDKIASITIVPCDKVLKYLQKN